MSKIDKRELRAYVRFDGTGRIVPSSLILRRKMPKVGKWVEIPAYECCNDITPVLYYTPTLPINYVVVNLFCNGVYSTSAGLGTPTSYSTIADLATALNGNVSTAAFGTYGVGPNGSLKLTLNPATIAANCPTGTLSMDIISD